VSKKALEAVLVDGSECQSNKLKRRLIRAGLKDAACEKCGRTLSNGEPIPLELDHINGRANDNRLENLRLLCPNCHAQTPTYRGRNIGKAR
jgi:5-methylcytosine-specific restriction endonuclease McrA